MLTGLLVLLSAAFFALSIILVIEGPDEGVSALKLLSCCSVFMIISLGLAWLVDYRSEKSVPCVSVEKVQ